VTLLRRAPREVYRVYDEDEFFACPVDPFADTERLEHTPLPRVASRGLTLRRLAGSTMLIAVAGALGSLAVLADRSQSGPARRLHTRELAASGSAERPRLAQAHVYRGLARLNEPAGADRAERRSGHGEPGRRIATVAHGAERPVEHATFVRRVLAAARGELIPAATESASESLPTAAATAPAPAPEPAAAPGRTEFGFERAGRQ
jgi:hypothetical protein